MSKAVTKRRRSKSPAEKLTINQVRFLEKYIKTGKLAPSWMEFNKTNNKVAAHVAAKRFLRNNPDVLDYFYEQAGISDHAIVGAIKDGFEAERQTVYKGQVFSFADPYARMKAAEIARRIKGYDKTEGQQTGNQLNVQIIAEKGEFKVQEG